DIASARHFADRIAVMYQGSLVEIGAAKAVIDRPLHPYTRGLIAAVPEPDPANRFRRRAVGGVAQAAGEIVQSGCPHGPNRANEPAWLLPSTANPNHLVACHVEAPHSR
ncbi:MAG TPA: hypothetical protein VFU81_20120, partial [Thermomicrobiales bacterium]|nr:hypothetical protein [Thermomicrobiales bacterium]